jgi:ATP-dependent protease HslVU (ClpYQ) peptidase subunit
LNALKGFCRLAVGHQRHDFISQIAEDIARKAMEIAAEICVYTNTKLVIESLESA